MTRVLIRDRTGEETGSEKEKVMRRLETVEQRHKECWGPPEAGRGRKRSSLEPLAVQPCDLLSDFWTPEL